jgi:predicted O-methyltransferase YrrM
VRAELLNLPVCEPSGRHWFWHGEQILNLLEGYRPKICVELGTHLGGSAIAVARLVRQWNGAVYCIDTWEGVDPVFGGATMEDCVRNIHMAGVEDVVRLSRERTDIAATKWSKDMLIDYLYVDADHSYTGCTMDLELWWPHVRVGGLVAGDDYDDPRQGVTQAWDAFEQRHSQQFHRTVTVGSSEWTPRLIWGIKR